MVSSVEALVRARLPAARGGGRRRDENRGRRPGVLRLGGSRLRDTRSPSHRHLSRPIKPRCTAVSQGRFGDFQRVQFSTLKNTTAAACSWGPTATPGTTGHSNCSSTIASEKRGEIDR